RIGETIDLPLTSLSGAGRTVVLFGRSTCGACTRTEPFYKDLLAHAAEGGAGVIVVVPAPKGAGDVEYARGVAGERFRLQEANLQKLAVRVLPTLLVVDAKGLVQYVREGPPTQLEQADMLQAVASSLANR